MPEPAKRLAIILVHYHTPALVRGCVESLLADLNASKLEAEIIVVDNGNDADGRAMIDSLPVRRIEAGKNLGYAGGVNLGVRATEADVMVVMNPDVCVVPGCLGMLVKALEQGAGAAGPCFYWDAGKTFLIPLGEQRSIASEIVRRLATYGMEDWARRLWRRHQWRFWLARQPSPTPTLTGALLAIRRDAWEKVGAFDEAYQLYFEETDWLLRLQWHGLRPVYVPAAEAVHMFNQSAVHEPAAEQWFQESERRFGRRYYGRLMYPLMQKLLPYRQTEIVADATPLEGVPEITLPETGEALWVEISPRALGFPAGGARVAPDQPRQWRLPSDMWERMAAGTYTIRLVDAHGKEGRCYRFAKTNP